MLSFFAPPETAARLSDARLTKAVIVGPTAGDGSVGRLMETVGLLGSYRAAGRMGVVVPLAPFSALSDAHDVRRLQDALGQSDVLLYEADAATRETVRVAAALGLRPVAPAAPVGLLHVHGAVCSPPAPASQLALVEAVLDGWMPKRYVLSGQRVGPDSQAALVAHCRRYHPDLVGCQDEESVHLLQQNGLDALPSEDDALDVLAPLVAQGDVAGDVATATSVGTFALHLAAGQLGLSLDSATADRGRQRAILQDLNEIAALLHGQYGGSARPLALSVPLSADARDGDTLALLGQTAFLDYFPQLTVANLSQSLRRGDVATVAQRLRACQRLITTSRHIAALGHALGLATLVLGTDGGLGEASGAAPVDVPSVARFLAAEPQQLGAEQRRRLAARLDERSRWNDRLAATLTAPPRDVDWVGRVNTWLVDARRELAEQRERADEAERKLAVGKRRPEDGYQALQLQAELDALQRRYAQQEAELTALRRELDLVFTTWSWRMTAPVRAVYEGLVRYRRTGTVRSLLRAAPFLSPPTRDAADGASVGTPAVSQTVVAASVPTAPAIVQQVPWHPDAPIVSVVVPCYNYGRYLEEAIESVLRQELQDFEIIVVDDGSTDPDTLELLAHLDKPKTRVIHQPNSGLSEARNTGIREARGKYICCLDADDTLEPTYLEKAVRLLESNSGVAFAYCWARLFGDEDSIWALPAFDVAKLVQRNEIPAVGVFARADWERVGGYRPDMRHGYEDWEFWLHLASEGLRGQVIPEVLFNHRRHGRTMTHDAHEWHRQNTELIARCHPGLFTDPGLIEKLRAGYRDRRTRPAFSNLRRPSSVRTSDAAQSLLVLVPWLPSGGAEAVLYQILKGLNVESAVDLHIVTSVPSDNAWHDRFYEITKTIYHLPNFLAPDAWDEFLVDFVTLRQVDTILVSASELGYSMLPRLKEVQPDVKIFNLLHNDSALGFFRHSVGYDEYIDEHIAVSAAIAEKLERVGGVAATKIRVIYNGVDVDGLFNPARYRADELRERRGLPKDRRIVSFIGRLSSEKRPDEFLHVASRLREHVDAHFILVGDGPLAGDVLAAIDRLRLGGCLTWYRGVLPQEVPEILAVSSVLAVTSSSEGFPLVVVEALSMGVPVVTYDVGDVQSAVLSGVNGRVVPQGQRDQFVEALRRVLTDDGLLQRLQDRARRTVIQRGFTLASMVAQYRQALVGSRRAGAGAGPAVSRGTPLDAG